MIPGVLVLRVRTGLAFWPHGEVAMVREELAGRLEALSRDGLVGHRPGLLAELEAPPFVRLAPDTLVNPAHAKVEGDHLVLPQGFRLRGGLPPQPPQEALSEDPEVPGLGVRASEVLYLEAHRTQSTWWTDRGPLRLTGGKRLTARQQAALHPDLRGAGQQWHVNPRRLRWMRAVDEGSRNFLLDFDTGTTLRVGFQGGFRLAGNLGLPDPYEPGPETEAQRALHFMGLRTWPFRLAEAPAEFLKQEFAGDPERLVANLAAQTVEARRLGLPVPDGDTHRAWYYLPARGALSRAGHLAALEPGPEPPPERDLALPDRGALASLATLPLDPDGAWKLTWATLSRLVGEVRAFTYRQMGFRDARPDTRVLGSRHPEVVLLVEKESVRDAAREIQARFGVTILLSGGVPSLAGVEFLSERLRARGIAEVVVVSYCDHDPVGWDMPVILAAQFNRYGLPVREIRRLLTPARFTAEELERLAVPVPLQGPTAWRTRVRRWVRETGGVGGKALGLYANHLQPVERVLQAFGEVAADLM